MPALVPPLKTNNIFVQSKVSLCVASFVCDAESRVSGGIPPLVDLLSSPHDEVRRSAAWALTVAASDVPTAMEVCRHRGLDALQDLKVSYARQSKFIDSAYEKLLDCNLSAKFALQGHLGVNNMIDDGFYDMGPLRDGARFPLLEELGGAPLDNRRPIFVVNALPSVSRTA